MKLQYSKHYKPTLYFGLVTTVTLVSLTVFHFSKLVIVFEKPKIDPLHQFRLMGIHDEYNSHSYISHAKSTEKCLPIKKLFFLKTHKTASSSVQNIILRFADTRNLTIALPKKLHYFSPSIPFKQTDVEKTPLGEKGYDILCHHLVYNQKEIEKVMPPETIFITIVRDPVSAFESAYEYNNLREQYGINIEEFAQLTKNASAMERLNKKSKLPRNSMIQDFGLSQNDIKYPEIVNESITNFTKRFDMVMLTEQFDESIVLLSHILCWDLKDMISFTNNARSTDYRTKLSDETVKLLRKWNFADQLLYDAFKKSFDLLIYKMKKDDLEVELNSLKAMRKKLYDACIYTEMPVNQIKEFKFWSKKIIGFKLKVRNSTCTNMVKPEVEFTRYIRAKQFKAITKYAARHAT